MKSTMSPHPGPLVTGELKHGGQYAWRWLNSTLPDPECHWWNTVILKTKDCHIFTRKRWNDLKRRCRTSSSVRHSEEHAAWTPKASLSFWYVLEKKNGSKQTTLAHERLREALKVKTPVVPLGLHILVRPPWASPPTEHLLLWPNALKLQRLGRWNANGGNARGRPGGR